MEKSFCNLIEKLHQIMTKSEMAHASMGKILTGLREWRRNGCNDIRIGNGDLNKIGWEHFLHGRIPMNLLEILPRSDETNNKKGEKFVEMIVTAVIIGAEAAWCMCCKLAAAKSTAGLAMGRKMRVAAKVQTLLYELKRMRISSIVKATAAQIMSRPDKEIEAWVSRNERF